MNSDVHAHLTRIDGIRVRQINITTHGNNLLKYSACVLWNDHLKFNNNKMTSIRQFKSYLKKSQDLISILIIKI